MVEYEMGVPGFSLSLVLIQKAMVKARRSGMLRTTAADVTTRSGKLMSKSEESSGGRRRIIIDKV